MRSVRSARFCKLGAGRNHTFVESPSHSTDADILSSALRQPAKHLAQNIAAAAAAVIEAAPQGKLALAEARDFMHLLELQRAAIETTADLAIRIGLLKNSDRGATVKGKRKLLSINPVIGD